jgi:predicted AAA+ superfamily ATPase
MSKKRISRYLEDQLKIDLDQKLVILAGPRQSGKTFMSKALYDKVDYLNYDVFDSKSLITQRKYNSTADIVILDELQKMPKWKNYLKGVVDGTRNYQRLLVTGSARLETMKKAGDSLAGRYLYFRLHPFDLKELYQKGLVSKPIDTLHDLFNLSGFPEPFLSGSESSYNRWRQTHLEMILRQDLFSFEQVRDINSIELLVSLLRRKVGSTLSINALANELQKDHKTVQRYLNILEDLFVIFRVLPYSKNIERAVKKEPKFYFYDTAMVEGEISQKLENQVACSLLKEIHFQKDAKGRVFELYFLKIKGGRELDFLVKATKQKDKDLLIEVKESDQEISPHFKLFAPHFKNAEKIQLVLNLKREFQDPNGVRCLNAGEWLCEVGI